MIADTTHSWTWTLSGWLYALLVLGCLLTVLLRKEQPAAALGWSLAIVFLPVFGAIAFFLFGTTRINRRLRGRLRHREDFASGDDRSTQLGATATRSEHHGPADETWSRLGRVLESLDQPPCRRGNACELYAEGDLAFAAMRAAIQAAEQHVHVLFYIFRDDELGRSAIDLLCEKARAGVQVRLLLDGMGSLGGWQLQRRLRAAGGQVASFLPLWSLHKLGSPNMRNHRKIIICDGEVAFCGGLNVGVEYLGRRRDRNRPWADLHMRIEGPAVWDLQWIFAEDWDFSVGERLETSACFPPVADAGDQVVQVLAGGPDLDPNPVREALLGAITRADESIWIASPYLIPDPALRDALAHAARAGVEVKILTQQPPPDHWLPFLCALEMIESLDAAGVQVLGHAEGMMHAKAAVFDGSWGMLGTANLDNRSMHLNFEVMLALRGGSATKELQAQLQAMMAAAVPLDAAWLARRPRWQRGAAQVARLLAPLM